MPEENNLTPADDNVAADAMSENLAPQVDALPIEEDLSNIKGEEVNKAELHRNIKPGMVVRVYETVADVTADGKERKRVQVFEGMVTALGGHGMGRTMTVRKVSSGFGVEKIYPLATPMIEKVEVVKTYKVRRAKLSFLKGIIKRGRVKSRFKRKLKEKV